MAHDTTCPVRIDLLSTKAIACPHSSYFKVINDGNYRCYDLLLSKPLNPAEDTARTPAWTSPPIPPGGDTYELMPYKLIVNTISASI